MRRAEAPLLRVLLSFLLAIAAFAEDPYRFFDWNVTYGSIYPLGVPQQGILINGQFPGPDIHSVTNDNLIINVYNSLDVPFLLSWNGVQNRRNSYEDGVWGTTCPIPPGKNFTYILQVKDQIGSFYYFPSLAFHKAAGGFGGIRILSRPRIPVPFADPAGDYTVLIGDWYKSNHTTLQHILDNGHKLPNPDGILINGRGSGGASFNVEQGKTYRLRISNVGLQNSLNFRIQGHKMTMVEVEGTHTLQTVFSSLDVHVGQSYSVLITADQAPKDYYIVVSSRFTSQVLTTTGVLRYANSAGPVSGPIPGGPTIQIDWSLNQARAIRTNLTASGPRPNPQGSYHYGMINTTRTIRLQNSAGQVNGKQRYAVNSVSFIPADTPLKLADYFKIGGVFSVGSIPDNPTGGGIQLATSVMGADYRAFVEIVFENPEDIVQSWHLDGYAFFVVGMDGGTWSPSSRNQYNLRDAIFRSTTQATYQYTERDAALYALGIGACGKDAVDANELKYVYHQDGQQFIKVLPTFSALFSLNSTGNLLDIPGMEFDPRLLLHGQQYIEIYKPLPSNCRLKIKSRVAGLHDKGKAAILEVETTSSDEESGETLCMNRTTVFLRGAGGFSRSAHPYSFSEYSTNKAPVIKIPSSQPFATFEDITRPPQALLYRLSGDYNPLHSDPKVADSAGFTRPILHGLCTLGYAIRAVIRCVCRGDSDMVKSLSGRFLLHVFPGETLITEMWLEGLRVIYQVKVKERNKAVLSGHVDLNRLSSQL